MLSEWNGRNSSSPPSEPWMQEKPSSNGKHFGKPETFSKNLTKYENKEWNRGNYHECLFILAVVFNNTICIERSTFILSHFHSIYCSWWLKSWRWWYKQQEVQKTAHWPQPWIRGCSEDLIPGQNKRKVPLRSANFAFAHTEEKATVVAAALGTELIQSLATLAILHQDFMKNRINCTRIIWRGLNAPGWYQEKDEFFKSSWCRIASAAKQLINSIP